MNLGNNIFKPITSKIKKINLIAFDVETCDDNQRFVVCDIYDGISHKTFRNVEDVKKFFLTTRLSNTFIVATNLQFDFTMIFRPNELSKFDIISRGSRFISVKFRKDKDIDSDDDNHGVHSIQFIDSLNHFAGSVESAGKLLGLPKLKAPVWLGKKYPENENEWNELIEYNKRDTEVTYKLMDFMQDTYNQLGANMKITISSTAMDLFKRKYLKQTLFKESFVLNDDNVTDRIFESYYGGRTEVFVRGQIKGKLNLYDINSLYPSMMLKEFPLPQSIKKISNPEIRCVHDYLGFSKVKVSCDYMKYPLLPYRDEITNKLIFPVGSWIGTYTHAELSKAVKLGYRIEKFYFQYIYTKTIHIFENYVIDLYRIRLELQRLNNPMEKIVKLLMNGLYGKTGERWRNHQEWFNTDEMEDMELGNWANSSNASTVENYGFYTSKDICNASHVYPIFASYVTSYGRCEIYDYIVKCNALYSDTDSIITKEELQTSNELGKMKLEQVLRKVIIVKPKFYLKESEDGDVIVKIKGVPINKDMDINEQNFYNVIAGEKVKYKHFTRLNESLRKRFGVNSVRELSKRVNLEDNKRFWINPFNPCDEDYESRPHFITDTSRDKVKRKALRLTNYQRYVKGTLKNVNIKDFNIRLDLLRKNNLI